MIETDLLKGVRDILSTSQRNNERDGVTGSLIFDKEWFLQILEGDLATIRATYHRIEKDPRHTHTAVMAIRPIAYRQFGEWSMGGLLRSPGVQGIFLAHGVGNRMDPRKLDAATVVDLALDLKAFETAKQAGVRKAS